MKRSQTSMFLGVGAVVLFSLGFLAAGFVLGWPLSESRTQVALAVALVVFLGASIWLQRLFHAFFFVARSLAEDAQLMLRGNPAYRVQPEGAPALRRLAETLNAFGDHFEALQNGRDEQIRQARSDLEEERNLLAALMSELTEGVLVCNLDGQVLLFNRSARLFLGEQSQRRTGGSLVGLGRSVFAVLDRNAISHALEQLRYRTERGDRDADNAAEAVSSFVAGAANGRLMRVRMAPFANQQGQMSGYVLTMQDMSEGIERSARRDTLLQSITERVRAAVGSMRAAIETIEQFPQMSNEQLKRFHAIIGDETIGLSGELDSLLQTHAQDFRAQWRLEEMPAVDLLAALQRVYDEKSGIQCQIESVDEALWLKVDSYALVRGVAAAVQQAHTLLGRSTLQLRLQPVERRGALDLVWDAGNIEPERWQAWQAQTLNIPYESAPTLKEVAEHHGGEVWFKLERQQRQAYIRLLLPLAAGGSVARMAGVLAESRAARLDSRPEYYDFDLFHQSGQTQELDRRRLRDLVYTAFDTETTGLDPVRDAIVSIGALRIVNMRLLRQDVFDQLVDPERPIPAVATSVHGISDEMVQGQPTAGQALLLLQRFAADTVLVGHNVAFDMRMFQENEPRSGVRFGNPVLDTLLLDAVVQPEQSDHSIEAIANRLGVNVMGRHTALGDAIVTAEIFLRLVALLEGRGISTLGEARAAAQATYFARLKY